MDQEKAFGRVSHQFLFDVLKQFGFGDVFIEWIKVFYNDIRSAVKVNGFITHFFRVAKSVRQGCPISAMLYVLTVEPLGELIRSSKLIKGITIPNTDVSSLSFQHADDITLTLADTESVKHTFEIVNKYCKASNARVYLDKNELLYVGNNCVNNPVFNIPVNMIVLKYWVCFWGLINTRLTCLIGKNCHSL